MKNVLSEYHLFNFLYRYATFVFRVLAVQLKLNLLDSDKNKLFIMEKIFFDLKVSALKAGIIQTQEVLKHSSNLLEFIEAEGVFSINEEISDLSDEGIKYLSVPFLHGLIITRQATNTDEERLSLLEQAQESIESFLSLVNSYGFDIPKLDASDRSDKIQLASLQGEVEYALDAIEKVKKDSESYRQISIDFVKYCILRSFNERLHIQRESVLLRTRPTNTEEIVENKRPPKFRPFVLGSRQYLKSQVFRPGHALPTLSFEEFYDLTYGQGIDKPLSEKTTKKEETDSEEDVYRQRIRDEYNDYNPSRSGNRINRS